MGRIGGNGNSMHYVWFQGSAFVPGNDFSYDVIDRLLERQRLEKKYGKVKKAKVLYQQYSLFD